MDLESSNGTADISLHFVRLSKPQRNAILRELRKEYWELVKRLKDGNLDLRHKSSLKKVLDVLNEINEDKKRADDYPTLSFEDIKGTFYESVYLKSVQSGDKKVIARPELKDCTGGLRRAKCLRCGKLFKSDNNSVTTCSKECAEKTTVSSLNFYTAPNHRKFKCDTCRRVFASNLKAKGMGLIPGDYCSPQCRSLASYEGTLYLKNCEVCGVTYLTKDAGSVKCHKTCKRELLLMSCQVCGKLYRTTEPGQYVCSSRCAAIYKNTEEKIDMYSPIMLK